MPVRKDAVKYAFSYLHALLNTISAHPGVCKLLFPLSEPLDPGALRNAGGKKESGNRDWDANNTILSRRIHKLLIANWLSGNKVIEYSL